MTGWTWACAPAGRALQPGGGPGQATHKVSLRDVREVDAEVVHLLRVAYEQNPDRNPARMTDGGDR